MSRRKEAGQSSVSATELAQMGACERMVWLEHQLGRRRTIQQEAAVRRGLAEHARFFDESKRLMDGEPGQHNGRCFVATLLLASSPQVTPHLVALRTYRDRVLKRSALGRFLVLHYYRMGPVLCRVLTRHEWLQRPVRAVVVGLARLAAAALARRQHRASRH